MRFVSLFAGVGGADLGLEAAGWECVAQVEWDKHCQQVLAYHWPDVPRWGDVATVNGGELPAADAIIFGSPCQDLSVAGKRAGLDGSRSNLFFEAVRIIREMRDATGGTGPRWAIWENVPGALTSNKGADFGAVLDTLAEAGALVIEWAVLDAQHFGVPQRRRRVFVVACFDPVVAAGCTDPLLPVSESCGRDSAPSDTAQQNDPRQVERSVGTCGPIGFSHTQGLDPQFSDEAFPTLRVGGAGHAVFEPWVKAVRSGARDAEGNLPRGVWKPANVSPTLNQFDNNSESRATVIIPHEVAAWAENVRNELRESDIAMCLSTGGGKAGTGYSAVRIDHIIRRLTPLECERLMGWPDNHTLWRADGKQQADTNRYRQCGNGIVTPVAEWIANQINKTERATNGILQ